ncbi:MAG: DEAD/DEAH box helicase family protein [Phycisphaerae bacterium]|nr:DEAD/DEAH box helicase family protein [Phycisphaerae bacterium]
MLVFARNTPESLLSSIETGAIFHDLGKLDATNQAALRKGRNFRLKHDHIDAGVAHVMARRNETAGWLIRAHHSPGLSRRSYEKFLPNGLLRGERKRSTERGFHDELVEHTNNHLAKYIQDHEAACGFHEVSSSEPRHGFTMRLALSCLVDADHSDAARYDRGEDSVEHWESPAVPAQWFERINKLDQYVAGLTGGDSQRNRQRSALYQACADSRIRDPIVSCEAAVGLGKTTAVTAYLLRCAKERSLRHLIIVAPYTNIISQTVSRLRKALVLPGERPDAIVAEHHHRAEFADQSLRDIATLWRAPIIVTTAVQFFETLAANRSAALRKVHELPGSAVFIDESHAAIPPHLWPQNWRWLRELAENWSCRFVLASGSLVRFWENEEIINPPCRVPELTPPELGFDSARSESDRVRPCRIDGALHRCELVDAVASKAKTDGPVLVILNTVQSAAVIARDLARELGDPDAADGSVGPLAARRVLHLSTALCPRDRARILAEVERRQQPCETPFGQHWILVATSCVEAGVDLDFQSGFRESCSVTSFIQVSGRINRHGLRPGASLTDFRLIPDDLLTRHPGFKQSASVLTELWPKLDAPICATSDIVTEAMAREIAACGGQDDQLGNAERDYDYPEVAKLGRVIDTDTCTVIVDKRLACLIQKGRYPSRRMLQRRSVQLWSSKIQSLALDRIFSSAYRHVWNYDADLYVWNGNYDADFLGIMADVLRNVQFLAEGGAVI